LKCETESTIFGDLRLTPLKLDPFRGSPITPHFPLLGNSRGLDHLHHLHPTDHPSHDTGRGCLTNILNKFNKPHSHRTTAVLLHDRHLHCCLDRLCGLIKYPRPADQCARRQLPELTRHTIAIMFGIIADSLTYVMTTNNIASFADTAAALLPPFSSLSSLPTKPSEHPTPLNLHHG
jgi:hypothetical protein